MAFDVGVVTFDYSVASPSVAAYKYACELMEYEDIDEDYWKVSAAWNVFLELEHDTMASHARGYIEENSLSETEANEVIGWVRNLPWHDDLVILHIDRH